MKPTTFLGVTSVLMFALFVKECDDPIFEPTCQGGFIIEAYEEDPFTHSRTEITNPSTVIYSGQNLFFETDYTGSGDVCWTVEGPCRFESSDAPRVYLEQALCEGHYVVSLEIDEPPLKYCDDINLRVTRVVSDTLVLDVPDDHPVNVQELCF